ncbi:RHS repeat-associated core domain-containing protein [Chryseobacterium sp. CFBP8996]|uniref:RHS repeat-associated core domain-containing protein n=1 Tax=Chryseobacterium sp. CFBP8996 TaxID=3096529 RepID=UPI002A6A67E4|nr:RHS repeat-associated core domain-containing protein [Chryseobacterium sp. CFBP8996]MDY0930771.1 RHS repeat-associated core domain-containing protein [Chryseobacterium sp. CFBP8996]
MEITDKNDYYPFGLNHIGGLKSNLGGYYNYKYQGQELQETGFYSFKWRNYMPDVGRFFNIDPLAEKYPTWAPYVFSGNRIIDARELEGLEPVIINNSNGKMEVNYFAKVTPKEGMTEQQVNSHLSEVSGILSQNESLKINMIHSETATFGINMTKTYQGYRISTNDKGEQVFTFVQGNAYQGNPTNQTINSGGEVRTTAHEIAHGLGLPHIFTGVPAVVPNTPENKDNLLNSDANSGEGMTPATGTKLVPAQIDVMKKVIELVQPVKTDNNDKPQQ